MVKILLIVAQILVKQIIKRLTPELARTVCDKFLDFIEDIVKKSDNTIDDQTILPLCEGVRTAYKIPDNDEDSGV